ncbi:hypothetical protein [Halosimplex salinum]|uniref:hypothetical protein n=1 Tax=Halosimplex salinum TaxID=1710538 RepID=UPI000F4A7502|nr:hypothetical protein [Halosimplex salinum]
MTDGPQRSRRVVLRLSALAVAGTAGCATFETETTTDPPPESVDSPEDGDGAGASADDEAGESTANPDETPSATSETADSAESTRTDTALDLREANVTDVEFEESDGASRFSVTLYHDDDGEDGYADWWQVETLDGERLGRRDLAHPHSTDPFTRSETVEIPAEVACVVVRGHDQTHEYGGRAMLVDLDSGEMRAVDQGSEPESFEAGDCP